MVGRVTVFGNGKLISVGTKSPKNSKKELKMAFKILKKYRLAKSIKITPQVRNIVGRYTQKIVMLVFTKYALAGDVGNAYREIVSLADKIVNRLREDLPDQLTNSANVRRGA